MKVKLLTPELKVKRNVKYKKDKNKFYEQAISIELLTIKLYERARKKLSRKPKNNEKVASLDVLINEDKRHLNSLCEKTGKKAKTSGFRYFLLCVLNFFFGLTFSLRVLERLEENLHIGYMLYIRDESSLAYLIKEEQKHRELLDKILEDYKLIYASMIVLSLNDAIVEMSAAIAGFTFALKNITTIYITSLITGISAALSMAASAFLSARQEKELNPFKAMIVTGLTYIITVFCLLIPYFPFIAISNYARVGIMLGVALFIVFFFNFYISVAKKQSLARNFFTMGGIAILIASISFGIGQLINKFFPGA